MPIKLRMGQITAFYILFLAPRWQVLLLIMVTIL